MIKSLTLSGRITLDMHALNNEGSEGNQLQSRMVHIVDEKGELQVVNAISGDMFKHIQSDHFINNVLDKGLPICEACKKYDANRINADLSFFDKLGDIKDSAEILNRVIPYCSVDDAEGILITQGGRSTPRKSAVEFGWVIGIPEKTRTESYFHVKFDNKRGSGSGDESGANLGQNIFYRPASSGQYAVVLNLELDRIGFNDITREYVISEEERRERVKTLLDSILFTFLKPTGAHRNTQNPHIIGFEGVISTSSSSVPAPSISGLHGKYKSEIEKIVTQLSRVYKGDVLLQSFDSQGDFTQCMADIIEQMDK